MTEENSCIFGCNGQATSASAWSQRVLEASVTSPANIHGMVTAFSMSRIQKHFSKGMEQNTGPCQMHMGTKRTVKKWYPSLKTHKEHWNAVHRYHHQAEEPWLPKVLRDDRSGSQHVRKRLCHLKSRLKNYTSTEISIGYVFHITLFPNPLCRSAPCHHANHTLPACIEQCGSNDERGGGTRSLTTNRGSYLVWRSEFCLSCGDVKDPGTYWLIRNLHPHLDEGDPDLLAPEVHVRATKSFQTFPWKQRSIT